MTRTSADVSSDLAVEVRTSTGRFHPLAALLLLAVAVRLPLAFWPNVNHPDEIFQYLEPAWRMLGHDGIVTWEWHGGIRSWFLPTLFVGRSSWETGSRRVVQAPSSRPVWLSRSRPCRSLSAPGFSARASRERMR